MAVARSRITARRAAHLGNAGRVFGLGITPTDYANKISMNAYAGYKGGYVWAYASEFPQLDFGSLADSMPSSTRFVDLVAAGVLTRDDVIAGFGVDPTFAKNNPANIDNGIMATNAFAVAPSDNTAFQQTVSQFEATATPAPTGPAYFLVNGLTVDSNGNPLASTDPHYYNALLDALQQDLAHGATRGAVTAAEGQMAVNNPLLVSSLPPDFLRDYGAALNAFLNPSTPPAIAGSSGASAPTAPAGTGSTTTPAPSGAPSDAGTSGGGSATPPSIAPSGGGFTAPSPFDTGAGNAAAPGVTLAGVTGAGSSSTWLLAAAAVGLYWFSSKHRR